MVWSSGNAKAAYKECVSERDFLQQEHFITKQLDSNWNNHIVLKTTHIISN